MSPVYIPGWGGIRIEDTVIVTKNGVEIITQSSGTINTVMEG